MGFLGLFSGPLSERQIKKIQKLACNPYAQPDVRMREMNKLYKDSSDAALRALLKRFAANANGSIADEDEKQWLEDKLADMGGKVLPALDQYIRSEVQLSYALRAYERIAGADDAVKFFVETLEKIGPDNHRKVDAKLQILWQLAEHADDPRVLPALIPFLHDHGDDVRAGVIDVFEKADAKGAMTEDSKQAAIEHLRRLVTEGEASPRIARRAAQFLLEREWPIGGEVEELDAILSDEYFLDKKKIVRRRAKAKSAG